MEQHFCTVRIGRRLDSGRILPKEVEEKVELPVKCSEREGVDNQISGTFYMAVVQAVQIFGPEISVMFT